jgi:hypothetical protein
MGQHSNIKVLSTENVEVGFGLGLRLRPAAQLVATGHAVVLAAAQHQVAERVADV